MKKLLLPLFLLFNASSTIAYAYAYSNSPSSSANPPESIEQDQAVPINPNIYGPAKPLSPPQGIIITPNAPTPRPSPNNHATSNQTSTNTPTSPNTQTPTIITPAPNGDMGSPSIEDDTTQDADPESDDVGTTPNQAS